MKRLLIFLISITLAVSLMFVGFGCKGEAAPPVEEAVEEEAVEEEAVEEEAVEEEAVEEGENMLYLAPVPGLKDKFSALMTGAESLFSSLLTRNLLMLNENMEAVYNDLATDWTVSDDGLTYEFTLREDAKWHDGVPVTPEDIKWSIEIALKGTLVGYVITGAFAKIEGADEWKEGTATDLKGVTVEGQKITIKLTDPVGVFPFVMAVWTPYPKHLLEDEDPATIQNSTFWEWPIGCGPYKLTEVVPNSYAIMEPFEDWYGDAPKIKKIKVWGGVSGNYDTNEMILRAKTHELDYFGTTDIETVNKVLEDPAFAVHDVVQIYSRRLLCNLNGKEGTEGGNKQIADIRVRQALMYALDRKTIAESLFPGQGLPTNAEIPVNSSAYNTDLPEIPYDLELAKQLLKDANFDFNEPITLAYYYTGQPVIDAVEIIRFYWEQLGIKVDIYGLTGDVQKLFFEVRDYDFMYAGLSCMVWEDAYSMYHSDSPTYSKIFGTDASDQWDPLVDRLRESSDPAERIEIVKEAQALNRETMYTIPIYSLKTFVLVNEERLNRPGVYGNEWANYDRSMLDWELK